MKPSFQLSPKKRAFLAGTLLLTGAGFACRVLGFFYRIYLSRTIGAEGLGLYHMLHPVFGICFALCAGSIQTALSQLIASHTENGRSIFRTGLLISMTMSFVLAFLICRQAEFLAAFILMEPQCAPYLPVMGIAIPFAAFHACINGYYYGVQKSKVPAFSQIAEQAVRMALVFALAGYWVGQGKEITVMLAVVGHLIGEIASAAFTLLCLCTSPPQARLQGNPGPCQRPDGSGDGAFFNTSVTAALMSLALPLMGNRLVLNILAGAEAIWIPSRLQMSGLESPDAFAVYGVLTGMALPDRGLLGVKTFAIAQTHPYPVLAIHPNHLYQPPDQPLVALCPKALAGPYARYPFLPSLIPFLAPSPPLPFILPGFFPLKFSFLKPFPCQFTFFIFFIVPGKHFLFQGIFPGLTLVPMPGSLAHSHCRKLSFIFPRKFSACAYYGRQHIQNRRFFHIASKTWGAGQKAGPLAE